MLEGVEPVRVKKREYEEREPAARTELLRLQYDLRDADFPVLLVLAGNDLSGLHDQINVLHEWMDARLIDAHAFTAPTPEEAARPELWRYWRAVPARGRLGVYLGGWTQRQVLRRMRGEVDDAGLERALVHVRRFERQLVADGALLVKLWLHLPLEEVEQHRRRAHGEPGLLLHQASLELFERPAEGLELAERVLSATDTPHAPWRVVSGEDEEHRRLEVARQLSLALAARLERGPQRLGPDADPAAARPDGPAPAAVEKIDLSAKLPKSEYDGEKDALQAEVWRLWCRGIEAELPLVLVFEGLDAAGKGGAIRRLIRALPATSYRVEQVSAPDELERRYPWAWRFWRDLPRAGRATIFDRSWYGRVLVERVEELTPEEDWRRGYDEICDLEEQLLESGAVLLKFWLHVSEEEQLRRFEKREQVPFKKYKITAEDYRNRARRDDYARAADEMVARTGAPVPWRLVASEDKRHARIEVLRAVADALRARLE